MIPVSFFKLVPGGNPTVLFDGFAHNAPHLAEFSAQIMDPLHLQAEQVGALDYAGTMPHLQMMGGEFCVNATRSAAYVLGLHNKLAPHGPAMSGVLSVSGAVHPVDVLVAPDPHAYLLAVRENGNPSFRDTVSEVDHNHPVMRLLSGHQPLCCGAALACDYEQIPIKTLQPGVRLVELPGISHILIDSSKDNLGNKLYPVDWQMQSEVWRKKTGLATAPAVGVVWIRRKEDAYSIAPAVYVAATCSEHMETACGSASLALAIASLRDGGETGNDCLQEVRVCPVRQLSGEVLYVLLPQSGKGPVHVYGQVRLAAQGETYLQAP